LLFKKLFPCALAACFSFCLTAAASAQSPESNLRQTTVTVNSVGSESLETAPSVSASIEERRPRVMGPSSATGRFDQLLLTAIETRLGSHYHYGSTGPDTFDCSGFVWSTFQQAGLSFTRGPARSYWATMPPATKEEQTKFGTLVFFSGLAHVGIVADEKGFYHASRHHGVIYSPFNDYWLARIDGFRRVPMTELKLPTQLEKTTTSKAPQRGTANTADSGTGTH